ncbi:unnamed protein product, partial [Allacma fusca]
MQKCPGKISLVVDCWTTRSGKSFHGILATSVDADWKYQQLLLDFDIMKGSHTGKKLAESVFKTLTEFQACDKLLAVTSDNASNMNTMFEELGFLINPGFAPEFEFKEHRIRCLAHIINLACQAALTVLKRTETKDIAEEYLSMSDSSDTDENADDKSLRIGNKLSLYTRLKRAIVKIRKSTI